MAAVDRLVQQVIRLVERDTVDGVASRRPPELSEGHVEMLQPLADNLDLPGRLATTLRVVSNRQDGRWHDRREDARAGLTELVALCADSLEPDPSLPPPVDAGARDRHVALGARVTGAQEYWTVLSDPGGLAYCLVARDPK